MTTTMTINNSPNAWDHWRKRRIFLTDTDTGKPVVIDRGVNFFVKALILAGAQTRYSCEGHPKGFYVLFEAPLELAMRIRLAGFFSVELERPGNLNPEWSIRLLEYSFLPLTGKAKCRRLRWAADAWIKAGLKPPVVFCADMATLSHAITNQERTHHVLA
jgi:hypothetical protein